MTPCYREDIGWWSLSLNTEKVVCLWGGLIILQKDVSKIWKSKKKLRYQKSHLCLPYQWNNICTMAPTMMVKKNLLNCITNNPVFKNYYIVHRANLNIQAMACKHYLIYYVFRIYWQGFCCQAKSWGNKKKKEHCLNYFVGGKISRRQSDWHWCWHIRSSYSLWIYKWDLCEHEEKRGLYSNPYTHAMFLSCCDP